MFEEFLEDVAQNNGLREVNTYIKLLAGLGAIVLCLLSTGYLAPLLIALVLTGSVLFLARVDAKTYAELYVGPLSFALLSIVVIVLLYGGGEAFWRWSPLPSVSLSVTRESINTGALVLCRVIGCMSALCFISLTTPMTDLFAVMHRCRVPECVIDLAMIIYRTIFTLIDQIRLIYNAQVMRLGYSGWRESIFSFASMCGAAFIASWDAGDDLIRAMDARCYAGKFAILGENRPVEPVPFLACIAFLAFGTAVVIVSQGMTVL